MATFDDWSSTAADNNTTSGVNIAEGCPAANMNNWGRAIMAQLRAAFNPILSTFFASTTLAQARTALGVTAGSTSLTNFGNLTNTAGKVPVMAGSDNWTLTDMFPVGGVINMAVSTAPSGWLECDGAAVSRTTYSALFAIISTIHGVGDGSTTFNVPDLRGEFVRGYDHGKGTDSGRAFGSSQAAALEAHTHTFPIYGNDTSGGTRVDATTDSSSSGTVTTSSTGGTETRPRNIALMFVIKT